MKYFIQATLTLKYGSLPRLEVFMEDFIPYMNSRGWTLIGAYRALVGDLNQVMHIWEAESLDSVMSTLSSGTEVNPKIGELMGRLAEFTEHETVQLVTKTSYSP